MTTLREYFDSDHNRHFSLHEDWSFSDGVGTQSVRILARIHQDLDSNTKYWSFFIPHDADIMRCIYAIFSDERVALCELRPNNSLTIEASFADYSEIASSTSLVFTKRIHLYIDSYLDSASKALINKIGNDYQFSALIRDKEYEMIRSQYDKPLAFISHDSRDKDELVRELANEMSSLLCPVWYDEYSLMVGDSLRDSIEKGLKEAKKCIVVLSPNFLSNSGWGKAEFDSIFTREIIKKDAVILPIWHKVNTDQVYEYCPRLADKVGLSSDLGIKALAQALVKAIKHK